MIFLVGSPRSSVAPCRCVQSMAFCAALTEAKMRATQSLRGDRGCRDSDASNPSRLATVTCHGGAATIVLSLALFACANGTIEIFPVRQGPPAEAGAGSVVDRDSMTPSQNAGDASAGR